MSASGKWELQTHIDLLVTRMRRLLRLTPESTHWRPWIDSPPKYEPSSNQARPRRKASKRRAQIRAQSGACGENTSAAW
jgi:hypothetical protein